MRNTSSVAFIGQGCWPKSSQKILTHLHVVQVRMRHSAVKWNSPLGIRGGEHAQLNEIKLADNY